jgi:hypothetical protein
MGVLPLFWSVPEALVTAELAPAFPEAAGYVAWAVTAFGPFWGWMKGWMSWTSGVADNALYPVLVGGGGRATVDTCIALDCGVHPRACHDSHQPQALCAEHKIKHLTPVL